MFRFALRSLALVGALSAFATVASSQAQADQGYGCYGPECQYRQYGHPDLFYNFYVPGRCGGVPAGLYPAPRPTPPLVGHTYYTYQPMMPHEMMYRHRRTYYTRYDRGRGLNRTSVWWW